VEDAQAVFSVRRHSNDGHEAWAEVQNRSLEGCVGKVSRVASILSSVSIPIFQGGRLRANLEATKARYQQAVAADTNQILIAYRDVEDALTDLHALTEKVGSLRAAVSASWDYPRFAEAQYRYGLVDCLIVIDAERTLLANELSLAKAVNLQLGPASS
jgi:multidrug efflux system outer membrane protein